MNKISDAITKINTEMQKDARNKYYEVVGQYVIDRITDEQSAELVLAVGKTLSGACDAIKAIALKYKTGNVAVVSDADGFAAVDKYFGFHDDLPVWLGSRPDDEPVRPRRVLLEDIL